MPAPAQVARLEMEDFPDVHFRAAQVVEATKQRAGAAGADDVARACRAEAAGRAGDAAVLLSGRLLGERNGPDGTGPRHP